MIAEDRLRDAMAACREAIAPSPDFFDQLDRRAGRLERQRRVRAVLAIAAVAAVIVTAVAIGVQRRSAVQTEARLKQAFVTRANQICEQAVTEARAVEVFQPNASGADLVAALQRDTAIDQAAIAALHSLSAPPSDRATVSAMLGQFDQAMGASLTVDAVGESTGQTDSAQFNAALSAASRQIAAAAQRASAYGVDRCADLIYPIF